ncbi:hypothetical protein VTI74DRAFT_2742 [Chaetomium olivicolor]
MAELLCAAAKAYLTLRSRSFDSVTSASASKLRASSSLSPLETHTWGIVPWSTSSHFLPMVFSNFLEDRSRRICDTASFDSPRSSASRDQSSLTWLTNSSYLVKTRMTGMLGAADCSPPEKNRFSRSDTERSSSLATQYHMQWTWSSCLVEGVNREVRNSQTRV